MGSDGYQAKAGMTGPARQLDHAGGDMDDVSSAVRSRTTYAYGDAGGDDAASALNDFVKAWEAEAKTLASALHQLGSKVQSARNTYRGTDGLVGTYADGVPGGAAGTPAEAPPRGGRTSILSSY
ncbi:hypothetical protein [Streptomyces sp. NPDC048001]|uniref:hypothetical protein n=1 Tax=unclassified Streptomyces TaxID=2593676 RepID=UPI0037147D06